MRPLYVVLLALLASLPAAAKPLAEVMPVASIPPVSAEEPKAAPNPFDFLIQPIETERGLMVLGIAAVLVVAVGRLRFRESDSAKS